MEAGRGASVEVIPGVEINTDAQAHEVHILGYFIDLSCADFQVFLRRMRGERVARARLIVEKLASLGVPVDWARILSLADGAAVGRPHIARALVEFGWVGTPQEAFERYLAQSRPAYVPRATLSPEEAIDAIGRAGGVPVLAHPGWEASGPILDRLPLLVEHGLCGIEVYYPDHTPAMVAAFLALARRFRLVVTGGTDYHGGGIATRIPLGGVRVPPEVVPALRARWEVLRTRGLRSGISPAIRTV
jgi:3',5'-nucleoside bisphosphate phosphatase